MKKTEAKAPKEETKTFVMGLTGGRLRRITVPASWKVTFGPCVPGGNKQGYTNGSDKFGMSLRFYEGKDHQRAVFTDVIWFRDASLKVEERVTKTKQKVIDKETPSGRKGMVVEARITEWRDPEAPDDETDQDFLRLTNNTEDDF